MATIMPLPAAEPFPAVRRTPLPGGYMGKLLRVDGFAGQLADSWERRRMRTLCEQDGSVLQNRPAALALGAAKHFVLTNQQIDRCMLMEAECVGRGA